MTSVSRCSIYDDLVDFVPSRYLLTQVSRGHIDYHRIKRFNTMLLGYDPAALTGRQRLEMEEAEADKRKRQRDTKADAELKELLEIVKRRRKEADAFEVKQTVIDLTDE